MAELRLSPPLPEGRRGPATDLAAKRWGSPSSENKVLAIHGRLDNAASFDGVGPLFAAAGYELVALDLPGHGLSPWKADGMYTAATQSASVVQALDALGWERCVCLAHSLGTAYATVAVASFPERFTACIFIEGFAGFGLTYAVDFGAPADGEEEDRQVTAAPESLRRSLSTGLAAISSEPGTCNPLHHRQPPQPHFVAELGVREPKNYESVAAAVAARTAGKFGMRAAGAEALVRRGGQEDAAGFHFTHDTRANVSYMLQVLSEEQACELMEQVLPPAPSLFTLLRP